MGFNFFGLSPCVALCGDGESDLVLAGIAILSMLMLLLLVGGFLGGGGGGGGADA